MRCKKGDLAIVLKSAGGLGGKLVEVGEFVGSAFNIHDQIKADDFWQIVVDGGAVHPRYRCMYGARDVDLLPIRPGELSETEEKECVA